MAKLRTAKMAIAAGLIAVAMPGVAQTRSTSDAKTAYGARLSADDAPSNFDRSRVSSRINSRVDSRLELRIERYRPASNDSTQGDEVRDGQDDEPLSTAEHSVEPR